MAVRSMDLKGTGYLSYFGRNMKPKANKSQSRDNPQPCSTSLVLPAHTIPSWIFICLMLIQVLQPYQVQRGSLTSPSGSTMTIPGCSTSTQTLWMLFWQATSQKRAAAP